MLTISRLRKSKPSVSEVHKTRSISNLINLRSLTSVLPPIHRSIVARRVLLVLMMERSIIRSSKEKCVGFVKSARSALQQAALDFLYLDHRGEPFKRQRGSPAVTADPWRTSKKPWIWLKTLSRGGELAFLRLATPLVQSSILPIPPIANNEVSAM